MAVRLEKALGKDKMKKFGMRALKWPFDKKEINDAVAVIERCKTTFNLALGCDQANLVLAIDHGVTDLKAQVTAYQADEQSTKISGWLSTTDPSSNYETARKKCQPKTGEWLFKRPEFEEWKKKPNSLLWLYGKPGCGKTILSSTVIQHFKTFYENKPSVALAYFYFDFNDPEKQNPRNFLSSLISQLCIQVPHFPEEVEDLYKRCDNGNRKAAVPELKEVLKHLAVVKDLDHIFIIVDALDECPHDEIHGLREEALGLIGEFETWLASKIHLLITSRRELDIEQGLTPLLRIPPIPLEGSQIDSDIELHISEQLSTDQKLKRWPPQVKLQIEKTLTAQADGMFRWVFCQLGSLKKCKTKATLLKELRRLPRTLDETYTRILNNIEDEYQQYARRALVWLAFSIRPLRIEELAEAAVVDPQINPPFDPEERFIDPRDNIFEILGNLVIISSSSDGNDDSRGSDINFFNDISDNNDDSDGGDDSDGSGSSDSSDSNDNNDRHEEIRLAHFSVKEYLVSERIHDQAPTFSTSVISGNLFIMESCIQYTIQYHELQSKSSTPADLKDFPLLEYSCGHWYLHGREVPLERQKQLEPLVFRFFLSETLLLTWVQVYHPDHLWVKPDRIFPLAKPLYYASDLGLQNVVKMLLEQQANVDEVVVRLRQTALHRAARQGHVKVVRLLLEHQADIDAIDYEEETALLMATKEKHETVVKLLVECHADVNRQDKDKCTALHWAIGDGNEAIVKLLLEHQANVNRRSKGGWTALHWAVYDGNEAIVKLLLEHQANVNRQSKDGWTALHWAAYRQNETIMRLLLEHQADVNKQDGGGWTALQLATEEGHEGIVRLLSQYSSPS